MELEIYRTSWGYPGTLEQMAGDLASSSRYAGIEADLPADLADQRHLAEVCDAEGLRLIPMVLIEGQTPGQQLEDFRIRVSQALELKPRAIVVHSGRDVWSLEESIDFYGRVVSLEQELGCRVAHETHRRRPLGTPWVTAQILESNPHLRLCCDFSHWVVVCERLLGDLEHVVSMAADRAIHLHARVGSDQAPQVQDPASSAAAECLAAFEVWWAVVWDAQRRAGIEIATSTPEYGPPPYQVDGGGDPRMLADRLSDVCEWQAARLRNQFDGPLSATIDN